MIPSFVLNVITKGGNIGVARSAAGLFSIIGLSLLIAALVHIGKKKYENKTWIMLSVGLAMTSLGFGLFYYSSELIKETSF